jgi:segregation and condensation protein B
MSIDTKQLQRILEGALMASSKPLTVVQLADLFLEEEGEKPANDVIRAALEDIQNDYQERGFELKEVSSGFRFQVVQSVATWVARLWDEKPQKYSRALLETLSLIAYRQPITRGDIEDIRGVAVSSHIVKTLLEREWVRVVGHKDVPGRPAMYATTRRFLDYFNLKNLDELPSLAEIRDLDSMNGELALEGADTPDLDTLDSNDIVAIDAEVADHETLPEQDDSDTHVSEADVSDESSAQAEEPIIADNSDEHDLDGSATPEEPVLDDVDRNDIPA